MGTWYGQEISLSLSEPEIWGRSRGRQNMGHPDAMGMWGRERSTHMAERQCEPGAADRANTVDHRLQILYL